MDVVKHTVQNVRRRLSGRFTVILGCQRSGTTLLFMMLTSHPDVVGLDENASHLRFPSTKRLLRAALLRKELCYKLPTRTTDLQYLRDVLSRASVLWMVRHPYAVVSSMKRLQYWTNDGRSWLEAMGGIELQRHAGLFEEIRGIDVANLSQAQLGACLWLYKMKALGRFQAAGLAPYVLKFEELLEQPAPMMGQVLEYIGLPWSERVLHHEQYHGSRVYSGETSGGKKLDKSRLRPALVLTEADKRQIDAICGKYMGQYGYGSAGA